MAFGVNGSPPNGQVSANGQAGALQPAANAVARIQGGGLTQVIVTNTSPLQFAIYQNGKPLPQEEVDTLVVTIVAPLGDGDAGEIQATISQKIKTITGEESTQQLDLFPGTIEIIALGRRVAVSSTSATAIEDIWIHLGLKPDGGTNEVTGAQELHIVLNSDVLSAELKWNDGRTEDLIPQGFI